MAPDGSRSPGCEIVVSPDRGPPGTVFNFSTDLFQPGEKVVTWLNIPGGQQPLDMTATADSLGRVWFTYNSGSLAVGDYALVAYGQRSYITAVGPFHHGSVSTSRNRPSFSCMFWRKLLTPEVASPLPPWLRTVTIAECR